MVILSVLKWIGIILGWTLAVILGIVLLLVLIVLFVPFRYRVRLCTDENGIKGFSFGFKVTWLLHAISVGKENDGKQIIIRLFGIPIKKIGGNETADDPDMEAPRETETDTEADETPRETKTDTGADETPRETETDTGADETPRETETDTGADEIPQETDADAGDGKKRKSVFVIIKEKINGIRNGIRNFFDKIDFIFFKISSIMELVSDKVARNTIKKLISEVIKMIRYIGPNKLKGRIEFGTGEPDTTGMLLAGASLLKLSYKKGFSIIPDFDNKCLLADVTLSGRIRVVYFIRMALRIWFDKDVHRLWKNYRRMNKKIKNYNNPKQGGKTNG
ncbi:MAG: DUF2953 domain-containing protein [Eubacterium sp.]|nr:DUF2953 domain-containing protein [Eubacterium sp.]